MHQLPTQHHVLDDFGSEIPDRESFPLHGPGLLFHRQLSAREDNSCAQPSMYELSLSHFVRIASCFPGQKCLARHSFPPSSSLTLHSANLPLNSPSVARLQNRRRHSLTDLHSRTSFLASMRKVFLALRSVCAAITEAEESFARSCTLGFLASTLLFLPS
jgi:hypothetical protein